MFLNQENISRTSTFKLSIAAISISVFFLTFPANAQQSSEDLHNLIDTAWEYQLETKPIFATIIGVEKYNNQLPEFSVEAQQQQLRQRQTFLDKLHVINRSTLSDEDKLNYDMFELHQKRHINKIRHKSYLIPITSFLGFHITFAQLPSYMPLKTVDNYSDYVSRLQSFQNYVQQHITVMNKGLKKGYTLPKVIAKNVPSTVKSLIVDDPTTHPLYQPFKKMPQQIEENTKKQLRQKAQSAIDSSVIAGYKSFPYLSY
jgi:uncharacterized protein (DUF885 family)